MFQQGINRRPRLTMTRSNFPHTVRESRRAKRVIIKVWASSVVEVVVPVGFDRSKLPAILDLQSEWISKQQRGFRETQRIIKPRSIDLKAIDQTWTVGYIREATGGLCIKEGPGPTLTVRGDIDDVASIIRVLNSWLQRKAEAALGEWLLTLGQELSIAFNRLTVRRQKTLWGSCSGKKNINLNRNLLFLTKNMARYVLVHELCHVKQPNHSGAFWSLVDRYVRNSKEMSARVRKAGDSVPDWANSRSFK